MKTGINTPQELEAKPGIIAVFMATTRGGVAIVTDWNVVNKSWKPIVVHALDIHLDAHRADLVVSLAGGQQVRVMGDAKADNAIVVVCLHDTPFGKSLPRTMRRLLKRMRDDRRATEAA